MRRRTLTDAQWARIEHLVPCKQSGKQDDRGRTVSDNQLFVDAILWLARTAAPCRNLPPAFGSWRAAHCRFRRWTRSGVWDGFFNALAVEPCFEIVLVDAMIFWAYADVAIKRGGCEAHAIGRSRGGLTTKIHAAVDALGPPVRFEITPGQWGDCPQARDLVEVLSCVGHVIVDADYDADALRSLIADDIDATAQIKQNPTRASTKPIDWALYRERHLIGCFFNHIRRFHRIALRCQKTASSFMAFVALACAKTWLARMESPPRATFGCVMGKSVSMPLRARALVAFDAGTIWRAGAGFPACRCRP